MVQFIYFPIWDCEFDVLIWVFVLLTFIFHVVIAWHISALRLIFYMSRIDAHLQRFMHRTPIRRYSRRLRRKLVLKVTIFFFIHLPRILSFVLHIIATVSIKPTSSSPFGPLLVISFSFIQVILALGFDSVSFSKIWSIIVSSLTFDFTTFHRWPKLGGISLLFLCIALILLQCLLLMKWPGFRVYIPILCLHIFLLVFLFLNCFVKIWCISLSASVRLASLASCIVHFVKMMKNVILSSPQMLFT